MGFSSMLSFAPARRRSGSYDHDLQPLTAAPTIIDAERGGGDGMPSPRGSREFHEHLLNLPRGREKTYPVTHLITLCAASMLLLGLCYLRISQNHLRVAATALRASVNATAAS